MMKHELNLHDSLDAATEAAGWNDDSRLCVVLAFLEEQAGQDPLLVERFEQYLDARVQEERESCEEE